MVLVSRIMHRDVKTVSSENTLRDVWRLISKKHINAAPVVDQDGHLIGIVTKEDMLQLLYPDYKAYINDISFNEQELADDSDFDKVMKQKVSQIMLKNVIHTHESTPIMRALGRMIAHRVNQLPVVDDTTKVVGIVTKGDIFHALYQFHGMLFRKNSKNSD